MKNNTYFIYIVTLLLIAFLTAFLTHMFLNSNDFPYAGLSIGLIGILYYLNDISNKLTKK